MVAYDSFIYHMVNSTGLPTKERWMYEFVKNKIYTHIKLLGWVYLVLFLIYEFLRSLGRIILYPHLTKSVIKGWWWNLYNLKIILHERNKVRSVKKISDWSLVMLILKDSKLQRSDMKFLRQLVNQDKNL